MIESKLVRIYLSLNKDEIIRFKKWIDSPFANSHKFVRKLYTFLESRKVISAVSVRKERAFSYLFPKEKEYDDLRMRHIMSLFVKNIELFLAYSYFSKNRNAEAMALAMNLQAHQLPEYATAVLSQVKQQQVKQEKHDAQFLLENVQMELQQFHLLTKNSRDKKFNLQAISDSIHQYSTAEILKYACISITHQNISNEQYSFALLPSILEQIEQKKIALSPAIEIYFYAYHTLTNTDENSYFKKLVNAVYRNESYFIESELKDIFMLCINHCIKKLNSSELLFAETAYKLYLHALDKKYLLDNNELSRFTFTNVVFIGLKLSDFKGVEAFIQKYGKYLNATARENTISFNLARLYFTQKNYKKTMPILLSVEYSDTLWNLAAKFMLVKIYFETQEYEALVALLNTFKVYLHRQKKIGYHKERYKNIIKFSEKLYAGLHTSKQKTAKLKSEIQQAQDLPDKEWFLEMLK